MRIVANPKVQKYNLFFDLLSTFIENVINICSQLFGLFCEQSKCQLSRDLGGFFLVIFFKYFNTDSFDSNLKRSNISC